MFDDTAFRHLPADVAERIKESAHAVLQLRFTPAQNLPETASRIGGVGYWPAHLDYPANANGQALALLAQFNLAELPRHPDLPESGILAFYIDITDDMLGMDDTDGARCIYFEDTNAPSLSRDEQLDLLPRAWREQLAGENADAEHDEYEDDDYTPSEEALAFAAHWQAEPAAVLQEWLTRREEAVARIGDAELTRLFAGEKAALLDWQTLAGQVEADCEGAPPSGWYDIDHALINEHFAQSNEYAARAVDNPQMQRWILMDGGMSEESIERAIHHQAVINQYLLTQGDPRWLQYWRHDPRAVILEDWAMQDELIRFYNDPATTALWQQTHARLAAKLDDLVAQAQAEHVASAPELDSVLEAHMGEVMESLRAGYMQADPARQADIHNLEQTLLAARMDRLAERFAAMGFTAEGEAPTDIVQATMQYMDNQPENDADSFGEAFGTLFNTKAEPEAAELLQHYLHAQDAFIAAQNDPELQQCWAEERARLTADPPQDTAALRTAALEKSRLLFMVAGKGLENPPISQLHFALTHPGRTPEPREAPRDGEPATFGTLFDRLHGTGEQAAALLQGYLNEQKAHIAAQTDPELRGQMQQHFQEDLAGLEADPPQSIMALYMALQEGALNRWFIRKGLDNPALQSVADAVPDDDSAPYVENAYCGHPVDGEYAVEAEAATHYLLHDNNEATRHYGSDIYSYLKAHGVNGENEKASHAFADLWEAQSTNHLLGSPRFSQYEPREEDDTDTVLLFQLDSGEHGMWGDAGTGHFFIRRDDLAAKRFDKAWFYWDCH